MPTLLIVNSSPRSASVSSTLTRQYARDWQKRYPDGVIVERNLSDSALPLMSEAWIAAAYTPETQRSREQADLLALSDQLIAEIMAADVIVLGVPMHNFSVPAAFKAWIDQIARVGKTFAYSPQGPKGLIPAGKKVIAVMTRGGALATSAGQPDPMEAYLVKILGLLGLIDVTIVHAHGQGMGEHVARKSVAAASEQVAALAQSHAALRTA